MISGAEHYTLFVTSINHVVVMKYHWLLAFYHNKYDWLSTPPVITFDTTTASPTPCVQHDFLIFLSIEFNLLCIFVVTFDINWIKSIYCSYSIMPGRHSKYFKTKEWLIKNVDKSWMKLLPQRIFRNRTRRLKTFLASIDLSSCGHDPACLEDFSSTQYVLETN